jgi:hypothetical protein
MMLVAKRKLVKSPRVNTVQSVEERTFILTTRTMDRQRAKDGPRSKEGLEESGRRMVLTSSVCLTIPTKVAFLIVSDGEENVFMKLYEDDLDSDVESVDEAPSPRAVVQSPVAKTRMSESERREAIHKVAQMNKV